MASLLLQPFVIITIFRSAGVSWSQGLLCGCSQTGAGAGHQQGFLTYTFGSQAGTAGAYLLAFSPHGFSSLVASRWPEFLYDGSEGSQGSCPPEKARWEMYLLLWQTSVAIEYHLHHILFFRNESLSYSKGGGVDLLPEERNVKKFVHIFLNHYSGRFCYRL